MKKILIVIFAIVFLFVGNNVDASVDWSDTTSPIGRAWSITLPVGYDVPLQSSYRFVQLDDKFYIREIIGINTSSHHPAPFNSGDWGSWNAIYFNVGDEDNTTIYQIGLINETAVDVRFIDVNGSAGMAFYNENPGLSVDELMYYHGLNSDFYIVVDYVFNIDVNSAVTNNEYYQWGFIEGQRDGYDRGLTDGFANGNDYGYNIGYDDGFSDAEGISYQLGYDDGYIAGDLDGFSRGQVEEFNGLTIITSGLFGFLSAIGNIQLLPGFKVAHILGVTMFFGLIYFIIGKKR